jgi:hypothetical protein
MLETLGDDARGWRSLALALLEDQQWSREFREQPLCLESALIPKGLRLARNTDRAVFTALQTDETSEPVQTNLTVHTVSSATHVPSFPSRPSGSSWFTAIAACMLLGFGIAGGMLFREFQSKDSVSAIASSPDKTSSSFEKPQVDRSLPMKMLLSGLGGSDMTPLEIPVVEANQMDANTLWGRDAQQLAALQQRLKREGYRMEWKPQFYSGRLNDGSHVVVPVHNVALKSVGL